MCTRHGQMEILKPCLTCTQYSRVKTKHGEKDLKDERLFWLTVLEVVAHVCLPPLLWCCCEAEQHGAMGM